MQKSNDRIELVTNIMLDEQEIMRSTACNLESGCEIFEVKLQNQKSNISPIIIMVIVI